MLELGEIGSEAIAICRKKMLPLGLSAGQHINQAGFKEQIWGSCFLFRAIVNWATVNWLFGFRFNFWRFLSFWRINTKSDNG